MRRTLATGCDLNYLMGATALLRSVRHYHPEVGRVCFTPRGEVQEAQTRLGDLAHVVAAPRVIRGVTDRLQMTAVRVFVPTLGGDTVVWADSDTVFCRAAPELWEVNPGAVTAVMNIPGHQVSDNVPPDIRAMFREMFPELDGQRGFNSGVFGIRPADWSDLPERFEAVIDRPGFADHQAFFDQPILNAIMLSRVQWLPRVFNASSLFDLPVPPRVRVVHFTSSPKPWMRSFPRHEPAYYYWLRYGVEEQRFWPLLKARLRIWARTPRRVVARSIRRMRVG